MISVLLKIKIIQVKCDSSSRAGGSVSTYYHDYLFLTVTNKIIFISARHYAPYSKNQVCCMGSLKILILLFFLALNI